MSTVERKCANPRCCKPFKARKADVARGWGKYCSKSCKAIRQEQRTGQCSAYYHSKRGECFPSPADWDVQ